MKRASRRKIAIAIAVLFCCVTTSGCGASLENDGQRYLNSANTTEYIEYAEYTESESQTETTEVESEVSTNSIESLSTEQDSIATEETTPQQTADSIGNTERISLSANSEENSKKHEVEQKIVTMVEEYAEESATEVPTYCTTTEVYTGTIAPGFDTNAADDDRYIPTGTTANTTSVDESNSLVMVTYQPYETAETYDSTSSIKKMTTSEASTAVTTVVETEVPTTTVKTVTTGITTVTSNAEVSGTITTKASSMTTAEASSTTTTKASSTTTTAVSSTTTSGDKVQETTTSGTSSNSASSNTVSPSKYNIKASDDSILLDETVLTDKYGLLNLYDKYKDYHIEWKLKSLDTGKSIEFNNSDSNYVSSCCTIKAALALYVCQQLEDPNCKETLDTQLFYDKNNKFHTHGGSGDIQKYGSKYYSIRELLGYCIKISDNDAYCVLLEHFGISNFNKWLKSMGSTSYVSESNVMGVATLDSRTIEWEAIVKFCFDKQNNSEVRTYLWEILTKASSSPIRNGIAKYTDLNVTVTHKSGWYNGKYYGTSNDCAVITLEDGRKYLMIIFTEKAKGKYDNDLLEAISVDLVRWMDALN